MMVCIGNVSCCYPRAAQESQDQTRSNFNMTEITIMGVMIENINQLKTTY